MADNRKIKANIRVGGKSFGPGQEDALAAALPSEDGERHLKSGALEGDWEFTGEAPKRTLPRLPLPLALAMAGATASPLVAGEGAKSVETESLRTELESTKSLLRESLELVDTSNATNNDLIKTNDDLVAQVKAKDETIEKGTKENESLRADLKKSQDALATAQAKVKDLETKNTKLSADLKAAKETPKT